MRDHLQPTKMGVRAIQIIQTQSSNRTLQYNTVVDKLCSSETRNDPNDTVKDSCKIEPRVLSRYIPSSFTISLARDKRSWLT